LKFTYNYVVYAPVDVNTTDRQTVYSDLYIQYIVPTQIV